MFSALTDAADDIIDGFKLWPLWTTLGWDQVIGRFRRTVLGPFWLSANLLALSFGLSVVFGGLMGTDYRTTFALITTGVLSWSLIGGPIGESAGMFTGAAGMMMSQKLPLSFHFYLGMYRIFINFICQLLTLWVVLALLRLGSVPTWQLFIGLPIVMATSLLIGMMLAIPAVRYRDLGQLVGFVLQLLFFITPIIWAPTQMSHRQRVMAELNPLAHLLAIVREPLLGRAPALEHYSWSIATFVGVGMIVLLQLALFRKRVVFWI